MKDELDATAGSLTTSLMELSEHIHDCYRAAISQGSNDVAQGLILLANGCGSLIAKALRGEIGGAS